MSETNNDAVNSEITPEDIHLPSNSYWPIVLALGFTFIIGGLAISFSMSIVGIFIVFVSAIGWVIEPIHDEEH